MPSPATSIALEQARNNSTISHQHYRVILLGTGTSHYTQTGGEDESDAIAYSSDTSTQCRGQEHYKYTNPIGMCHCVCFELQARMPIITTHSASGSG